MVANGDLVWFQHLGRSSGTVNWTNGADGGLGNVVGSGWDYQHVFASNDDAVVYAITDSGELLWFQHFGRSNGTVNWANGGSSKTIGHSWDFRLVFASDDAVIYGIKNTGDLYWYQHLGRSDGTDNWANGGGLPIKVGHDWNFQKVFPADNGVLYGIDDSGILYWYQHLGRSDGTDNWANGGLPIQVGEAWGRFESVFAADDGVIYAVAYGTKDLYWWRHLGRSDGTDNWANGGQPIKVGASWYYRPVFAANDAVIYGVSASSIIP